MELQRWMFALILTGALFACTKEAKQEQQVAAKTAVASEAKAPDFARPMLLHDFVDLSSLVIEVILSRHPPTLAAQQPSQHIAHGGLAPMRDAHAHK